MIRTEVWQQHTLSHVLLQPWASPAAASWSDKHLALPEDTELFYSPPWCTLPLGAMEQEMHIKCLDLLM